MFFCPPILHEKNKSRESTLVFSEVELRAVLGQACGTVLGVRTVLGVGRCLVSGLQTCILGKSVPKLIHPLCCFAILFRTFNQSTNS